MDRDTRGPAARALLVALAGSALLVAACRGGGPAAPASPAAMAATVAPPSPKALPSVSADERQWAGQALQILDTVEAGVEQFHASTAAPAGTRQSLQLRQQAYSMLAQAVGAYERLLPSTEAMPDASLRDPFTFVMGNVNGFLNPTPDLPGDPPTLGDRIGRSLDNAISGSAALRPKLQQIAGQG